MRKRDDAIDFFDTLPDEVMAWLQPLNAGEARECLDIILEEVQVMRDGLPDDE